MTSAERFLDACTGLAQRLPGTPAPFGQLALVGEVLRQHHGVVATALGDQLVADIRAAAAPIAAAPPLPLTRSDIATTAAALCTVAAGLDLRCQALPEPWSGWHPGLEPAVDTAAIRWTFAGSETSLHRQSTVAKVIRSHRILRNPDRGGFTWHVDASPDPLGDMRAANGEVRVLVWSSDENPTVTTVAPASPSPALAHARVHPDSASGADLLIASCAAAGRAASAHDASILVIPELFVPHHRIGAARLAVLGRHPRHPVSLDHTPPVLTVMGLSHRASPIAPNDANTAVAFDQRGRILWTHGKTNAYVGRQAPPLAEVLVPGSTLWLRWTSLGWVSLVICVELFSPHVRELVGDAAPRLVLVPSLSPSTSAHRTAARSLASVGTASAVANWWGWTARDRFPLRGHPGPSFVFNRQETLGDWRTSTVAVLPSRGWFNS